MPDTMQKAAVDAGPAEGPLPAGSLRVDRFEVQLKDALTGEILGYGGGQTPEEAARHAIEDANVSGEMLDAPAAADDGAQH